MVVVEEVTSGGGACAVGRSCSHGSAVGCTVSELRWVYVLSSGSTPCHLPSRAEVATAHPSPHAGAAGAVRCAAARQHCGRGRQREPGGGGAAGGPAAPGHGRPEQRRPGGGAGGSGRGGGEPARAGGAPAGGSRRQGARRGQAGGDELLSAGPRLLQFGRGVACCGPGGF